MTELKSVEGISGMFDEIKSLVSDVKYGMMSGEDCNNQFYSVLQALDNISTSVKNIESEHSQPSDEFAIIQTNLLEVKKELSTINQNIDDVINKDLRQMISKMSEKVNRLEILTNNAGIDQQIIKNVTGEVEKNISSTLKENTDVLHAQSLSATNDLKKDIGEVNTNLKECVDYLEKAVSAASEDAVNHISDDIALVGTTVAKSTDNLKRSVIDIFTRIQESISDLTIASEPSSEHQKIDLSSLNKELDSLKSNIANLNVAAEERLSDLNSNASQKINDLNSNTEELLSVLNSNTEQKIQDLTSNTEERLSELSSNTEQRLIELGKIIGDLDIFHKLETFSKVKDLPAVGEMKSSLQAGIGRLVDEYSQNIQRVQTQDEVFELTKNFRADVYNSLLSLLGRVSDFLEESSESNQVTKAQIDDLSGKIDELSSVTELNSSGYNNIQIVLKDVSERCEKISDAIKGYSKNSDMKNGSLEDYLTEIRNSVSEIYTSSSTIKEQNVELGNVVRECANSVIEGSEPDRHLIKDMLSDIRKNISILQSGDEESEYTYSMQDIESDIANIRVYLNDLTKNGVSVNSEEFKEELDGVVVMVDSMKQQMNKIDECNLPETLSTMKEDLMSASTRINKLLLSSDNSYNMISSALNEFKLLSEEIDKELKTAADSNKFKNIEDGLTSIKVTLSEGNSYNSVINQSLVMLAEWVDNAGETITDIYEKQSKLDSIDEIKMLLNGALTSIGKSSDTVIESVKSMIDDTNMMINTLKPFDYSTNLKLLDEKIEEQASLIERQESKLNKLDEKLTTILEFIAKNDSGVLSTKMADIDSKMERLNKSIERLTAYVDED